MSEPVVDTLGIGPGQETSFVRPENWKDLVESFKPRFAPGDRVCGLDFDGVQVVDHIGKVIYAPMCDRPLCFVWLVGMPDRSFNEARMKFANDPADLVEKIYGKVTNAKT